MRMQPPDRGSTVPTQGLPNCWKGSEDATTETTADKGGSNPRCQSENNAAKLSAEAAGCPKEQDAALVSGIDFPIQIVKVRQPLHRQAVVVSFAVDVHFHQMLGKPFAGTLGFGTVCKSAIYDQRAINGQSNHRRYLSLVRAFRN